MCFVDLCDFVLFELLIDVCMKVIFVELVGNLFGNVIDIVVFVVVVYCYGILLIVDNMVLLLYLLCLFEYGVDIVVYLLMKYFGGYGMSFGGVIVDLGKFLWVDYVDCFKWLNELDVSYYGVVYIEVFGLVVYIGCVCVVLLCNMGVVILLFNVF